MALITGAQYKKRLGKMKPNAYYRGEKIENLLEHPVLQPGIETTAEVYDLTLNPEYQDLMTDISPLTGERVSGFVHMPRSRDDLMKELKRTRFWVSKTFGCISRCNASGLIFPLWVVTYDMDQKLGTNYHQRFKEFMRKVKEEDLACTTTVSDVKGDRSKRRKEQSDPDLYVRVVEKKKDGIIVRGAKAHASAALFSNFCMVGPSATVGMDEREYAVCFAMPLDAKGVTYIAQDCVNQSKRFVDGGVDFGMGKFGEVGGLMIMDDVFIPEEHIFMCGEAEFMPQLIESFATFHRNTPVACRAGQIDDLIGAALCIAEYNGVAKAPHIRSKITEMAIMAETAYASALGAAWEAHETPSGVFHTDAMLANAARTRAQDSWLEAEHLLVDIAGGLSFTMPSEKDLRHPVLGKYINKYLRGVDGVSTEDRLRMFRLIQNMVTEGRAHSFICAGGSPEPHRVFVYRLFDREARKKLAKELAGIKT